MDATEKVLILRKVAQDKVYLYVLRYYILYVKTVFQWRPYEAVVQETVTMSDGEIRLIVERTTEIYGNPLNSLHIGEETELLDIDGNKISVEDLQPGIKVKVTLKDSFTEETPFYYPIVYEIKTI